MEQIIFRPQLHRFDTCADFAKAFSMGPGDLVLTNRYLYEPFFSSLSTGAIPLYQEEFGSGEPTDSMVDAIIARASSLSFNRIIAIGGGTVIDIAKVLAVSGGQNVDFLYDHRDSLKKHARLVILPTTCGTGSEVTNISIINRTRLGVKMGLTGEALFADEAVLIPQLLSTLPFPVFAASSIDALVHAMESALSPKATPYTKLFGYKAIEMILCGYLRLVSEGRSVLPELLDTFLTASNYAGLAFGTAGCAAVHALSYPLGGTYHVAHGESNYAMLTGVLRRYMAIRCDGELAVMTAFIAKLLSCPPDAMCDALEALLNNILPKKALHEYGMKPEEIDAFADSVMATQGRLMANNFVPLSREDVAAIYASVY